MKDYALSEVLLRESREKRELLGLDEHLTTDQASLGTRWWPPVSPPGPPLPWLKLQAAGAMLRMRGMIPVLYAAFTNQRMPACL